jgi:transcriptional regulator GlxA family with amidase domain
MSRFVFALVAGALVACQSTSHHGPTASAIQASAPAPAGQKNIGILIFDGVFITEFSAPFDTYKHVGKELNVFTVAPKKGTVTTYEGVILQPDYAFGQEPKIDVLVVPSGIHSIDTDLENSAFIGWIQGKASSAEYVTSHCWGAFSLAKAGLLDGRECTTFPSSIDDLQKKFPKVQTRKDQRFVVAGKTITSNGGLAAYEAALYVVEKLFGKEKADGVATGLVFAPQNRTYAGNPRIL